MIITYIICKNKNEAKKISKHLLKKRLIACGNIIQNVESLYWWKGKIVNDKEVILLCKTKEKKFNEIKKEVEKIHSYEIPCILKINVKANEKYLKWLEGEVN